jgi:hypothetical protein
MNACRVLRELPDPDAGEVCECDCVDDLTAVGGTAGPAVCCARPLGEPESWGSTSRRWASPTTSTQSRPPRSPHPGVENLERRVRHLVRWNSAVERWPEPNAASMASAAIWRNTRPQPPSSRPASTTSCGARLAVASGTAVHPGARVTRHLRHALLEGLLGEADFDRFRREVGGSGLPSTATASTPITRPERGVTRPRQGAT